jgi:hypothetical protein
MSRKWLAFVVDTDTYAGNFERSLLAYVTGQKQDNFHDFDEKTAERVQDELPPDVSAHFENNIGWGLDDLDDAPMMSRVTVHPTPGWFNHGMGGHYKDGQEAEAFEHYKQAIADYEKAHPGCDLHASPTLNKCPAYQSVAIFINEVPPPEILSLMKERATAFCKDHLDIMGDKAPPIEILGFRFVEQHVTYVERPA